MRIEYGPGCRVYFQQRGPAIALLLCAGEEHAGRGYQASDPNRERLEEVKNMATARRRKKKPLSLGRC